MERYKKNFIFILLILFFIIPLSGFGAESLLWAADKSYNSKQNKLVFFQTSAKTLEIWIIDINTAKVKLLSREKLRTFMGEPSVVSPAAWSPDGNKIAYTYFWPNRFSQKLSGLVVKDVKNLKTNTVRIDNLSPGILWASDNTILYMNEKAEDLEQYEDPHGDDNVYIFNILSNEKSLVAHSSFIEWSRHFREVSGDGKYIFMYRSLKYFYNSGEHKGDLIAVPINGKGKTIPIIGPLENLSTTFSPDKKRIMYTTLHTTFNSQGEATHKTDIFISTDKGEDVRKVCSVGKIINPIWSFNKEYLYYNNYNELFKLFIRNGNKKFLCRLPAGNISLISATSDGKILFLLDKKICIMNNDGTNVSCLWPSMSN